MNSYRDFFDMDLQPVTSDHVKTSYDFTDDIDTAATVLEDDLTPFEGMSSSTEWSNYDSQEDTGTDWTAARIITFPAAAAAAAAALVSTAPTTDTHTGNTGAFISKGSPPMVSTVQQRQQQAPRLVPTSTPVRTKQGGDSSLQVLPAVELVWKTSFYGCYWCNRNNNIQGFPSLKNGSEYASAAMQRNFENGQAPLVFRVHMPPGNKGRKYVVMGHICQMQSEPAFRAGDDTTSSYMNEQAKNLVQAKLVRSGEDPDTGRRFLEFHLHPKKWRYENILSRRHNKLRFTKQPWTRLSPTDSNQQDVMCVRAFVFTCVDGGLNSRSEGTSSAVLRCCLSSSSNGFLVGSCRALERIGRRPRKRRRTTDTAASSATKKVSAAAKKGRKAKRVKTKKPAAKGKSRVKSNSKAAAAGVAPTDDVEKFLHSF